MAKAYWVTTYRSISNPDALAAYSKLAGPAVLASGGKFPSCAACRRRRGSRG